MQVSQAGGSSKHMTSCMGWKLSHGSVHAGTLFQVQEENPGIAVCSFLPAPHAELLLIFACLDFRLC